jgi:peptidoglycan hydrolase-like amidase
MVESEGRTAELKYDTPMKLSGPANVTGRFGALAHFRLSVPGRIEREYFGRLEIRRQGTHLLAIVEMDLETAVSSIVQAEGTNGIPFEARKAQAVAARSYLLAAKGMRHVGYDFCDLEHCQFLRDVPAVGSAETRAAAVTRGQVLVYKGKVIPALYSANCGGHTRNLAQAGWEEPGRRRNYPYYEVSCPLAGPVNGHRVGMCQLGAIAIAKQGAVSNMILAHYFPNTAIGVVSLSAGRDVRASR